MLLRSLLIASIFSTFASFTYANNCDSRGCKSFIESIYTNAEGNIYIGTLADETKANCTTVSGTFFSLNPANSNAKEIYSLLMASYMAEKKVWIRIKEESSNCEIDYVELNKNFI